MNNLLDLFYQSTSQDLDREVSLQNLVNLFLFLLGGFKKDFYGDFEDKIYPIYADIISFIDNPKCSCKIKIAKYIENNYRESYYLVETWFKNKDLTDRENKIILGFFERLKNQNLKIDESKKFRGEPSSSVGKYMSGRVVSIDDTPEEFNKLINYLKENDFYYNHMSVVKSDNNQIKIYFA
jgi:hypothetical protein